MKIAAVSEDGVTISQHFGRAPFYIVVTIEKNTIVSREKRDKMGHARMAAAISDCEVLLARGMGAGAYESMRQANIQPIITDIANIDEAIQAYLAGALTDHPEKLH